MTLSHKFGCTIFTALCCQEYTATTMKLHIVLKTLKNPFLPKKSRNREFQKQKKSAIINFRHLKSWVQPLNDHHNAKITFCNYFKWCQLLKYFNLLFLTGILIFILLHEKFLQFDWLRAVVFQLNLKYLHVKITNLLRVVV